MTLCSRDKTGQPYFVVSGPNESIVAQVTTDIGSNDLAIYAVARNEVLVLAVSRYICRRAAAVISPGGHRDLCGRTGKELGRVGEGSRGIDDGESK